MWGSTTASGFIRPFDDGALFKVNIEELECCKVRVFAMNKRQEQA